MTHDELRDELARAMGWKIDSDGWYRGHDSRVTHPVPPTADAALAVFERLCPGAKLNMGWHEGFDPPGRYLWVVPNINHSLIIPVPDTGNFAHDLCSLTLAAVRAKGGEADGK